MARQALSTGGWHARMGTGAFPAPRHTSPQQRTSRPPPPRDPEIPASPAAGQSRHREPRAGPEPTSSRYPRPQRRGGRAGARKRPKPNSPRPPEKPTTPPVSLSPAAPGRPPRSSPRPPQGSRRRHEGSAGARVGVNGGARSRQGAHRCVTLPCSAILREARRPQAEVGTGERAAPDSPIGVEPGRAAEAA